MLFYFIKKLISLVSFNYLSYIHNNNKINLYHNILINYLILYILTN